MPRDKAPVQGPLVGAAEALRKAAVRGALREGCKRAAGRPYDERLEAILEVVCEQAALSDEQTERLLCLQVVVGEDERECDDQGVLDVDFEEN